MGLGPESATGCGSDLRISGTWSLPTIALSVIPLGVMTRTVRATIKEILSMEFVTALQAKSIRPSDPVSRIEECRADLPRRDGLQAAI